MGAFDWLFKSEKNEKAPGMAKENTDRISALIDSISRQTGSFDNVNGLGDVKEKYGIGQFDRAGYMDKVKNIFNAKKSNLNTSLAKQRSNVARRMSGREAVPEFAYSPVETDYALAMGDLEGQEAGLEANSYDKERGYQMELGNFLANLFGRKDAFKQWKTGATMQGEGMRSDAVGKQIDSMNDDSLFGDILGAGNMVGSLAGSGGLSSLFGGGGKSKTDSGNKGGSEIDTAMQLAQLGAMLAGL